jgi:hypothetical protein
LRTLFAAPQLTESFLDEVVRRAGGRRFTELFSPPMGMENPDYVFPEVLAEVKILEEEGLNKSSRQAKLARLLDNSGFDFANEDFYDNAPPALRREIESLFLEPIKGAVKKAGKQFSAAKSVDLFRHLKTVLIAVNSGYSSVSADLFRSLVLRTCRKDTSRIDYVACLSVHHHHGPFDTYIFLKKDFVAVREAKPWAGNDAFLAAVGTVFDNAMTKMMTDQMNPELWAAHLPPVEDIFFEGDGVTYVRRAPEVPDSRMDGNGEAGKFSRGNL